MEPECMYSREEILSHTETCLYCMNMCRFACPVTEADKKETSTPFAKMGSLNKLIKTGNVAFIESAWLCTGCDLCTAHCVHETPVSKIMMQVRADESFRGGAKSSITPKREQAQNNLPVERDQILDAWLKVSAKIKATEFDAIPSGNRVFIPDSLSLRHKPAIAARIFQHLEARYPEIVSLLPEVLQLLEKYELGMWKDLRKQLEAISGKPLFFICENPADAWALKSLPPILGMSPPVYEAQPLNSEGLPELTLGAFQLVFSSYETRKLKVGYALHEKSYSSQVTSMPFGALQNPADDSPVFRQIFPELHERILQNKWRELEQRKGDLVCSDYRTYLDLKESKPSKSKKKIYYLGSFFSNP